MIIARSTMTETRVSSQSGAPMLTDVKTNTRGRTGGLPVCCNKCFKPLTTNSFRCSCDCLFCDSCTFTHFKTTSECPICFTRLGEKDFKELIIADPSTSMNTSPFQAMFTKSSSKTQNLSFPDIFSQLLRHGDDFRSMIKFALKQAISMAQQQTKRATRLHYALQNIQREFNKLKQSSNSEKIEHEQVIGRLKQQVALVTNQLHEQERKLAEKERQLAQFRQLHNQMTPAEMPRENSQRGSSRGSGTHNSDSRPGSRQQPSQQRASASSGQALQGYLIQKEAQKRATQQEFLAPMRGPILGNSQNHSAPRDQPNMYIAAPGPRPPQPRPAPPPHHLPRPHSNGHRSIGSASGEIRKITPKTPFLFTSVHNNNNNKRQRISPSQAFAGGSGGGSGGGPRGPSNMFQVNPYASSGRRG